MNKTKFFNKLLIITIILLIFICCDTYLTNNRITRIRFINKDKSISENECLEREHRNNIDNKIVSSKIKGAYQKLIKDFNYNPKEFAIIVSILEQKLYLLKNFKMIKIYPVSTSKYGIGNRVNSNMTPLGTHEIYSKIGEGFPIGSIFKNKTYTGKKAQILHNPTEKSQEDLIITRILTLKGLEESVNSGKGIDSYYRGIFIHGTQEEGLIGTPASHGCIRMKNKDIIELFDMVKNKTLLEILN